MEKINTNHDRTIESFRRDLDIIKKAGFKPIGVSQMYIEDTFIFKTQKEATLAYHTLETGKKGNEKLGVVGWWYGKKNFVKAKAEYEKENEGYSTVLVHWIDGNI